MTLKNNNLNEVINFNRGTGATYISPKGLIVGVDFSATSNDLTTGTKTFTLTADANVNRNWTVGEPVIAVSQAAPLGSLTGTVTSYDPATQTLVIDAQTVEGTGAGTDWRIGTLKLRRDANGGAIVEPSATNRWSNGENGLGFNGVSGNPISTQNFAASPTGKIDSTRVQMNLNDTGYVKADDGTINISFDSDCSLYMRVSSGSVSVSLLRRTGLQFFGNGTVRSNVISVGITNGWQKITGFKPNNPTVTDLVGFGFFAENDSCDFEYALLQAEDFISTSVIPTNGIAVTRARDILDLTPTAINSIRQGEATVIVEAETADNGLSQKSALTLTGDTGEIRVAKEGVVQTVNFTDITEFDGKQVFSTTTLGNDLLVSNGVEFSDVSLLFVGTNSNILQPPKKLAFGANKLLGPRSAGSSSEFYDLVANTQTTAELGSLTLNAAHWTGSQFVLPTNGVGRVALTDGDSYRIINDPNIDGDQNDATHDPLSGRIILSGFSASGGIWRSDNGGDNWQKVVTGVGSNQRTVGITWTGSHFIGVQSSGFVITSPTADDNAWTQTRPFLLNGGATLLSQNDVHHDNSITVSVGVQGSIFTSIDNGVTWQQATSNTTVNLLGVTYSPEENLWVACGSSGTVVTAVDPLDPAGWTVYDNTTTPATGTVSTFKPIHYFNGKFYIGWVSNVQVFDPIALTFAQQTSNASGAISGISTNGQILLIAGQNGVISSSTDGTTFLSRTNNNATLNGVAFGNNRFVSVGNAINGSSYIATIDPDGTVTRRVGVTNNNNTNIRYLSDGAFYICGNVLASVLRSIDNGETFQTTNLVTPQGGDAGLSLPVNDICFNGSIYLAVGQNGNGSRYRRGKSVDGLTFVYVEETNYKGAIACANLGELIVLVGFEGQILTTVDGDNYTLQTSGTTNTLRSVIFSERDQRWYVAGDNATLLYSYDAITWKPVQDAGFAPITENGLQASLLTDPWQEGTNKIALAYKANNVRLSINGSTPVSDTLAKIPAITNGVVGDTFNGSIKKITFKTTALSDAELQTITGV